MGRRIAKVEFDPYREWFGISAMEAAAEPLRLFGMDAPPKSPEDVYASFIQRVKTVREYECGPHAVVARRIFHELCDHRRKLLSQFPKKERAPFKREKKDVEKSKGGFRYSRSSSVSAEEEYFYFSTGTTASIVKQWMSKSPPRMMVFLLVVLDLVMLGYWWFFIHTPS